MIVGIDIGTQSLKAVVATTEFEIKGAAARTYTADHPRPGWSEQEPALWEAALGPAIAEALRQAEAGADSVSALGIAGQLDGCIATDADGTALAPCLIWMDRRAQEEVAGLNGTQVQDLGGVVLDPSHMAAKIRWLKRHRDGPPARRFHQPVSYMVARLTGADVIDHGLASTTMLYGLAARSYEPALLAMFEVEAEELPTIADAASVAGGLHAKGAALTGLPRGVPVAVGTGDDFSAPLGGGLGAPGRMVAVVGTAEVVGAIHDEPVLDPGGLVETHAYVTAGYFIENPGWLSGGAVAWLREVLGLADFEAFDTCAGEVPAGAEGVSFLPGLSGAMAPEWNADARGCFYGLCASHGAGHLARAVLEGCAFGMRDVGDRLVELGIRIESILLLGGGARSREWGQIRADLTGLPVHIPKEVDTSPIGAAMLAAVAIGAQPDLASCARLVGGSARVVDPDPSRRNAYDGAYATYRRLFESLKPMFGRIS